jgi:hypothetical protein
MRDLRLPALLAATVSLLGACGGGTPAATQPTASSSAVATTSPQVPTTTLPTTPAGPFVSTVYGYSVSSPGWTGSGATTAWDGTGDPPGSGDPTIDALFGPTDQRAYAYSEATDTTLTEYVTASRQDAAAAHQCPVKPEATRPTKVGGEPAILDEVHCPPGSGVFAPTAYVVHAGRTFVFFTYDQPGNEAKMRDWFGALLEGISFTA